MHLFLDQTRRIPRILSSIKMPPRPTTIQVNILFISVEPSAGRTSSKLKKQKLKTIIPIAPNNSMIDKRAIQYFEKIVQQDDPIQLV